MAPSTTSTLTIHPWSRERDDNNGIQDVLARAQRGHLRDITEASLQEEMAAEGALDLSGESGLGDDDDGEGPAKKRKTAVFGKPSTREDLFNARGYMLQTMDAARNEVSIALDLMSLAVSKELPRQAQATLGTMVKNEIPLGTIGVDVWQRMPDNTAREAQDALLAANVKMDGLQSSADGLLNAAKRMEETVRKETQYWDQILSISSKGWNVSRVPGQSHKLGVRYGFSESAPQFSRKGIAALNADRDGGIHLERGSGSKSRALRALLRRNGEIVGSSRLPELQDDSETTLEARIRRARDSLFDEELYHEMVRESRALNSLGVTLVGASIHLQNVSSDASADAFELDFDLIALDEPSDLDPGSGEEDGLAQATILAARLLLSQAHRDRLRKRSQPPPPLSDKQKDESPVLPILRPLIAIMLHQSALHQLNSFVSTTSKTVAAAKVQNEVSQPTISPIIPGKDSSPTEVDKLLTTTLLRPLISTGTLTFPQPPSTEPSVAAPPSQQTLSATVTTPGGSTPVYALHMPTAHTYHFNDFVTFASATSSLIASMLANLLLPHVQNDAQEWKVRADEAVLEQDVGIGELERSFAVEVDGVGGTLGLTFTGREGRTFSWSAAGSGTDEGASNDLFEAAMTCLV